MVNVNYSAGWMTRERQILDTAAKLFYERGFHLVGVDEIGAQVGVTGPAIYRHFSGKDHLLATLYHEALDELFLRIGGRLDDPEAELQQLIRASAEFAVEHRELLGIYTREDRALADPWRQEVARRTRTHMKRWTDVLQRCYPHRSTDEIGCAAYAAVGLLHSVAHWPRTVMRATDVPQLLVHLVSDGLASLQAAAPTGPPTVPAPARRRAQAAAKAVVKPAPKPKRAAVAKPAAAASAPRKRTPRAS
jgi:AcrR family transcriptional regulator